jgi:hypothetical protein
MTSLDQRLRGPARALLGDRREVLSGSAFGHSELHNPDLTPSIYHSDAIDSFCELRSNDGLTSLCGKPKGFGKLPMDLCILGMDAAVFRVLVRRRDRHVARRFE